MVTNKLGKWAKERLIELAKETDLRLAKYWGEELKKDFGFNETQRILVRKMLLHAKEHNLRSAKRARAGFVIWGYTLGNKYGWSETRLPDGQVATDGVRSSPTGINEPHYARDDASRNDGGKIEGVWRAAEAVELVHTALLMHDDFMDGDKVRRGGPTTQEFFGNEDAHYGDTMAINVGDAILCMGFDRLLECSSDGEKTRQVMNQVFKGITQTAFGQAYDVSLPKLGEMTEEKVMSLHRAKTAIYTFENPLVVGGMLAGLSDEILMILKEYAADGGVAFQLQDDVLGIYGDEGKTGKSADSDLLQGKVTLLIVKTLEIGTEQQKNDLLKVWGSLKANKEEVEIAKKAIMDSGAYEYSVRVAKNYAEKAAETATKLRGKGLNDEAIDYLEGIARYMVEREV